MTHRDDLAEVRCTFQPRNGGWFDRCRENAVWQEKPLGPNHTWFERRCERHRKVDARTVANRGWGRDKEYLPFDAGAVLIALSVARRDRERLERLRANHQAMVEHLDAALALKALSEVDQQVIARIVAAYK